MLRVTFAEMESNGSSTLTGEGFAANRQRHERSLAMRYHDQSFEIEIKQTKGDIVEAFHHAHRERYGYAQEASDVEVVSARVRSIGLVTKTPQQGATGKRRTVKAARTSVAHIDGKKTSVTVYEGDRLLPGVKLQTPCIVTEYSSTTLIPAGTAAHVDGLGNMIITVERS